MKMDDVIQIVSPAPDSHWRLKPCRCGSDNVAYEQYNVKVSVGGVTPSVACGRGIPHPPLTRSPFPKGEGETAWRCKCFDCGYTVDKGNKVRHDAQVGWNGGAA